MKPQDTLHLTSFPQTGAYYYAWSLSVETRLGTHQGEVTREP